MAAVAPVEESLGEESEMSEAASESPEESIEASLEELSACITEPLPRAVPEVFNR